jgi:hypothetical protein
VGRKGAANMPAALAHAAIKLIGLTTTPLLKLRRLIWHDGGTSIDPEDYEVIDARGEKVGRLYRTIAVGGGQAWNWTVNRAAAAGQAPTAFRAAWAACQPRERGA